MRILIIKTSALGDIIHALPVLGYLREALPDAEIGWVVEEHCKDILEGHPDLAHLHILCTRRWRSSLFSASTRHEIKTVATEVRRLHYDCILDIQGNFKSGIVGVISGVARRIGFPYARLQERGNIAFTTEQAPFDTIDNHATLRCLSVAHVLCGLPYHRKHFYPKIAVSEMDIEVVERYLARLNPGRKVLFHTGTTWQTKFWSQENWVSLGKRVCKAYPDVTLLLSWGSPKERATVDQLATEIGQCVQIPERYPLKPFVALLERMSLVLGGDTGPVHLAAAVGTPTVSLYRSSDGSESGPRGDRHKIVQSPLPCSRCFKTSCSRDAECQSSISVDMVFSAIESVLSPKRDN